MTRIASVSSMRPSVHNRRRPSPRRCVVVPNTSMMLGYMELLLRFQASFGTFDLFKLCKPIGQYIGRDPFWHIARVNLAGTILQRVANFADEVCNNKIVFTTTSANRFIVSDSSSVEFNKVRFRKRAWVEARCPLLRGHLPQFFNKGGRFLMSRPTA